ncbi:MAG: extracellular solute-binding protein, partial [Actinomycetota bacterium]|nr:extracellular solute-binding protein [Actinomycetota bacterium]
MVVPKRLWTVNRRDFLKMGGATLLLVACGDRGSTTTTTAAGVTTTGAGGGATAPTTSFRDPRSALSGDLRILLWSHFVPSHDVWFDEFVQDWGDQVGINVSVDHIGVGDVPAAIAGEIQSGSPQYDLMQYIAVLSQHEPSVVDMADLVAEAENRYGPMLDLTRKSSFNPNTGKFYAYAPAWVPDPGDYRKSLWESAGLPNGPSTWDELLT